MSSLEHFFVYLLTLVVFLLVDFIWLSKIAPKIYRKYIGHLLAAKPKLQPAAIFYMLYALGVVIFAVVPALNRDDVTFALIYGALFGLIAYATFDLTSEAVFKKWPTTLSLIDMLWGTILTATTSLIVYVLAQRFVI